VNDYAPLADRLASLAEATPHEEVCGFVVADGRGRLAAVPMPNRAGEGRREAFLVDPAAHLALARRLRAEGGRIAAVFHSHVDGPAWLSPRDLEGAVDGGDPVLPGADQIVIGMESGKVTQIQVFEWSGSAFVPRVALLGSVARRVGLGAP
jgi:proteasome lid subunit RPN8/RPN11